MLQGFLEAQDCGAGVKVVGLPVWEGDAKGDEERVAAEPLAHGRVPVGAAEEGLSFLDRKGGGVDETGAGQGSGEDGRGILHVAEGSRGAVNLVSDGVACKREENEDESVCCCCTMVVV